MSKNDALEVYIQQEFFIDQFEVDFNFLLNGEAILRDSNSFLKRAYCTPIH